MLLSAAYFPPVEYFSLIRRAGRASIDKRGNYQKQSYRNRFRILTANGVEDLRFPVVHDGQRSVDAVKVDYSTPWVSKTRTALDSAYYSSPFYEYYRDELFSILESCPATVWDLDYSLTCFFCRKVGLPVPLPASGADDEDFRELVHPKREPVLVNREYWQVFRDRYGFVPNLSIIDLLSNEGPESICYL